MNRPPYGNEFKLYNDHLESLKVHAQLVPNMTVRVNAGIVWMNEVSLVEFYGGSSSEITAPVSNAKWVLICLDSSGRVQIVDGTPSPSPVFPQPPYLYYPLAGIFIQSTTTKITEDMIYDLRPIFAVGNRNLSHSVLTNRSDLDSHPISAITNLNIELSNRPTFSELTTYLGNKCDSDGTESNIFKLNKDYSGVPSENCTILVERGASADVAIRWNEEFARWELTNDGTNYSPISSGGLETHTHTSLNTGGFLPASCINSGNLSAQFMPLYGDWLLTGSINLILSSDATNVIREMLVLKHTTVNTANSGFGASINVKLDSSNGSERDAGAIKVSWHNATDLTRISRMSLCVYDYNNIREGIIISSDGNNPKLGFFGIAPVSRPSAYTQIYIAADKTLNEYIQNSQATPYVGIDNQQPNQVYAKVEDLNTLRVAYENLRNFAEDAVQMLNSLIDDLQSMGLLQ